MVITPCHVVVDSLFRAELIALGAPASDHLLAEDPNIVAPLQLTVVL